MESGEWGGTSKPGCESQVSVRSATTLRLPNQRKAEGTIGVPEAEAAGEAAPLPLLSYQACEGCCPHPGMLSKALSHSWPGAKEGKPEDKVRGLDHVDLAKSERKGESRGLFLTYPSSLHKSPGSVLWFMTPPGL